MEQIEITGGHALSGTIRISGAKNAALPVLTATLLADGEFIIDNVPNLQDVETLLELMDKLNVEAVHEDGHTLKIKNRGKLAFEAPYELVKHMRASILVLGPLVTRIGRARVALPGGCAIGARPIDLHMKGLELMGATLEIKGGFVEARAKRLSGARIYFDISSVTGTENLMMAACLAKGETVLENAAREPEVVTLGYMLEKMGARIRGLGTETIKIEGVNELRPVKFRIIPDRIEAGTYLMAAGAAGGELVIEDCRPEHMTAVIEKLRAAGLEIEVSQCSIQVRKRGRLKSIDVKTLPYPGFPTDLQAQMMVLMSLAQGLSVMTETIFENRFMHVAELKRLGADIKLEGRNAIIRGVECLTGAPVMATDLRASASLILAGLAAYGKTIVQGLRHLDRGYERMDEKLAGVGARIRRTEIQGEPCQDE